MGHIKLGMVMQTMDMMYLKFGIIMSVMALYSCVTVLSKNGHCYDGYVSVLRFF